MRTEGRTDRPTDMTELTFALRNFSNTFNKVLTREDHVRTSVTYYQMFMKFGSDVFISPLALEFYI